MPRRCAVLLSMFAVTAAILAGPGCTTGPRLASSRADWAQWRGPQRNGVASGGPALPATWAKTGPRQLWQSQTISQDVGAGSGGGYGSVVVADGRAYVFVNRKQKQGGDGGPVARDVVLAWEAETGRLLWERQFNGRASHWGTSSTPCIADRRCYVVGSSGTTWCLDARDGSTIWSAQPSGATGGVSSSIQVVADMVILMGAPLTALDADTGQTRWQQPALDGRDNSTVLWRSGDQDYLICNDQSSKGVACVRAADGKVIWSAVGGGRSTAVIRGDTMVVLTPTMMAAYKLALDQPHQLWRNTDVRDRGASPVIHGDHVYHVGGRGQAACIELATGKVAWMHEVPDTEITSPIVADGKIIVAQSWGEKLTMIEPTPEHYRVLAEAKMPLSRAASPAVAGGKLYVRLKDAVACYDLANPGS